MDNSPPAEIDAVLARYDIQAKLDALFEEIESTPGIDAVSVLGAFRNSEVDLFRLVLSITGENCHFPAYLFPHVVENK
eukprot:2756814-Rhodomonas_salina.1